MTDLVRLPARAAILALVTVCVLCLTTPVAAHPSHDRPDPNSPFPEVIKLPDLWRAEGIATGRGSTVYSGSLANGAIWRGDLRTGQGSVLVPGTLGNASVGLKYHHGLLFVAGGGEGTVRVYDARTGEQIYSEPGRSDLTLPTFVNDVTVTRDAAWFTDSMRAVVYKLALVDGRPWGKPIEVPLRGEWEQVTGFNANGITATPDGSTLLVVNSVVGKVYRVRAESGVARAVRTTVDLTHGDGILLRGRELDVVRNSDNQVVVLRLSRGLRSARLETTLTDPDFDVPTTIAEFGCALYAVNAKFRPQGTPPATTYEIVRVDGSCQTSHHSSDKDWEHDDWQQDDWEHDDGWHR